MKMCGKFILVKNSLYKDKKLRFKKIFFYGILYLIYHVNLFADANIAFSNNSDDRFKISSQIMDIAPIAETMIYPFVSNTVLFHLPTIVSQSSQVISTFHILIEHEKYFNEPISVDLTLKRTHDGYLFSDGILFLPTGKKIFDPISSVNFDLSHYWANQIIRFVPSKIYKNGTMWPSLTIVIDTKNVREDQFNNQFANTFKVMSYNVQLWPFYADLNVPSNKKLVRARSIPQLIGDSFDYVAFNEIFDADIRRKIKNDMKKNYPYFADVGGIDSLNVFSSGIVVFSKWPIIKRKYHTYRSCYDFECFGAKGITYVQMKKSVNGYEFDYHVFATHMQSKLPGAYTLSNQLPRFGQLKELQIFIQEQNIPTHAPIIILGDFNIDTFDFSEKMYNSSYPQTEYEFMLHALNAEDSTHSGLKYSFDGLLNTMLALSSKEQSKIDHILYERDHLKPIYSMNTVRPLRETENAVMYPNYDTSDHFPIIGEFVF